jgi:hypothetical protein
MGLRAEAYDCRGATCLPKSHDLQSGAKPTYAAFFCGPAVVGARLLGQFSLKTCRYSLFGC